MMSENPTRGGMMPLRLPQQLLSLDVRPFVAQRASNQAKGHRRGVRNRHGLGHLFQALSISLLQGRPNLCTPRVRVGQARDLE